MVFSRKLLSYGRLFSANVKGDLMYIQPDRSIMWQTDQRQQRKICITLLYTQCDEQELLTGISGTILESYICEFFCWLVLQNCSRSHSDCGGFVCFESTQAVIKEQLK